METGKGNLIATYTGVNQNPLPSFSGSPQEVGIDFTSAEEAANGLYNALGPRGDNDFRVTAAALFRDSQGKITLAVKNRHS